MPSRPVSSDELAEAQLCQRRNEWHGGNTRGLGISQSTGARRPILQRGPLGPGAGSPLRKARRVPRPLGRWSSIRDMTRPWNEPARRSVVGRRDWPSRGHAALAREEGVIAPRRLPVKGRHQSWLWESGGRRLSRGCPSQQAAWRRPADDALLRHYATSQLRARLAPESGSCSAGLPKPATTQGASPVEDRLASAGQVHRHSRSVIHPRPLSPDPR